MQKSAPSADLLNSLDCFATSNVFVPISLGNHYYSLAVLKAVIEFISKTNHAVVFLCDRLRFLSYRIRGEANLDRINSNIHIQLDQINRVLVNLGIREYSNIIVANWSFIYDDARFFDVLMSLEKLVREDPEVHRQIHDHCTHLLHRFHGLKGFNLEESMGLQLRFIMEESALSLYMTEIRGYNVELYRRGIGFIDYLYCHKPDSLRAMTGKPILKRKFVAIEHWLASSDSIFWKHADCTG
jgi:hypothetical protein